MFDPNSFLDSALSGENSTELKPVPAGEYIASVKDIKTSSGSKEGRAWASLNVQWTIEDPVLKEEIGRTPVVFQRLFLDLDDQGNLSMKEGKNVELGRFRAALDINQAGASLGQAVGRQARVKISHREYQGNVQAEVKGVVKA